MIRKFALFLASGCLVAAIVVTDVWASLAFIYALMACLFVAGLDAARE